MKQGILAYNIPYHSEYNPVEYINVIKGNLKNQYIDDIKKMEERLGKTIDETDKSLFQNCCNAYKRIAVN